MDISLPRGGLATQSTQKPVSQKLRRLNFALANPLRAAAALDEQIKHASGSDLKLEYAWDATEVTVSIAKQAQNITKATQLLSKQAQRIQELIISRNPEDVIFAIENIEDLLYNLEQSIAPISDNLKLHTHIHRKSLHHYMHQVEAGKSPAELATLLRHVLKSELDALIRALLDIFLIFPLELDEDETNAAFKREGLSSRTQDDHWHQRVRKAYYEWSNSTHAYWYWTLNNLLGVATYHMNNEAELTKVVLNNKRLQALLTPNLFIEEA